MQDNGVLGYLGACLGYYFTYFWGPGAVDSSLAHTMHGSVPNPNAILRPCPACGTYE